MLEDIYASVKSWGPDHGEVAIYTTADIRGCSYSWHGNLERKYPKHSGTKGRKEETDEVWLSLKSKRSQEEGLRERAQSVLAMQT